MVLFSWDRLQQDFDVTTDGGETFGLSVFLRDGDRVFRTYFTTARGVETLGPTLTFLYLTPFGRQETWEESPAGYPQTPPYELASPRRVRDQSRKAPRRL